MRVVEEEGGRMREYVFRYANGYGCDMSALMDGGRQTVGDYFASDATDHYGTLHEEIVRCRDCVYYKPDPYPIDPGWPMYCEDTGRDMIEPDGYCAWGERKEGGE